MKLKSIEISGFKSFADKTTIDFQDGLTGIVGPNGSGKSNVIEAIRWVLGEQSAKTLRGNKMPDVIFSGSKDRRSLNRAEVSIYFDNADHYLDSPYSDIKVSRKVYRNGDSEYSLNDKECRLRDINNLFMDTGLGEGSLSIISQGNVDEILNDNAEKRRAIIETAAGIYKYKKQKNETEKKLNDTQENLDRISDIIAELEKQVGPLKQQSEDATKYLEQRKYLDQLTFTKLSFQVETNQKNKVDLNDQLAGLKDSYGKLQSELSDLQTEKRTLTDKIGELNSTKEQLTEEILENTKTLESANSEKKLIKQRQGFNEQKKSKLNASLAELNEKFTNFQQKMSDNTTKLKQRDEEIASLREQLEDSTAHSIGEQVNEKQADLEKTRADYIDLMQELADAKNDLKLMQKLSQRNDSESKEKYRRIKEVEDRIADIKSKNEKNQAEVENLLMNEKSMQVKMDEADAEAADAESHLEEMRQKWYDALRIFQETKTERDSIKTILENNDSLYRGTKNLLKNKNQLSGIEGTVNDFIDVPSNYVTAIETALGSQIQQVIVDSVPDARSAIKFLNEKKLGRVTFLPVNAINERFIQQNQLATVENIPGFIGVAADLVKMPEKMNRVKNHLLGNIIIADNLKDATKISNAINHRNRVVTVNGEVINAGGSITGGTNRSQNSGLLTQKEKLKKLNAQVESMQQRMDDGETQLKRLQNHQKLAVQKRDDVFKELNDLKNQIKLKQKDIEVNTQDLTANERNAQAIRLQLKNSFGEESGDEQDASGKITELTTQIEENQKKNAELKTEIEDLEKSRSQSENDLAKLKEKLVVAGEQKNQLVDIQNDLKEENADFEDQLTEAQDELQEIDEAIRKDAEAAKLDLPELEKAIEQKSGKVTDINQALENSQKRVKELDNQIDHHQTDLLEETENVQRCQSRLKVVSDNLLSQRQQLDSLTDEDHPIQKLAMNLDQINAETTDVQNSIDELGPVNINSIDAYAEIKERYDFLKHQLDDLIESKKQLIKIMNKMDETVKTKFKKTYDEIAEAFTRIFRNIFGGGDAKLKMDDPHHLLTTGIDILVKPPGKKYRNINLLSGGEKALTALALLFATLEVKPVPFVILDEAESALDPANVDRFAKYMESLKKNTQFIVITHRKETMVYADNLYGVTMQDSGVSKVVSVNLDESKKIGD